VQIFAPLARLLGLYSIKEELEELSFKFSNPEAHGQMVKRIRVLSETQHDVVQAVSHSHQSCFVIEHLFWAHSLTHSLADSLTRSLTHLCFLSVVTLHCCTTWNAFLHLWLYGMSICLAGFAWCFESKKVASSTKSGRRLLLSLTMTSRQVSHIMTQFTACSLTLLGRQGCCHPIESNRQDLFGGDLYIRGSFSVRTSRTWLHRSRYLLFTRQLFLLSTCKAYPCLHSGCLMTITPAEAACGSEPLLACRRVKAWSRC